MLSGGLEVSFSILNETNFAQNHSRGNHDFVKFRNPTAQLKTAQHIDWFTSLFSNINVCVNMGNRLKLLGYFITSNISCKKILQEDKNKQNVCNTCF